MQEFNNSLKATEEVVESGFKLRQSGSMLLTTSRSQIPDECLRGLILTVA